MGVCVLTHCFKWTKTFTVSFICIASLEKKNWMIYSVNNILTIRIVPCQFLVSNFIFNICHKLTETGRT